MSKRTTIHKNLILSLASAEGFLMTSEWAKTNKVGNQQVTGKLWDQSPPLLPAGGFLALVESKSQRRKTQAVQMTETFSLTLLWMSTNHDRGIRVTCAQS